MRRTWQSITVELVGGRGETLWPRPGRVFAAARRHTFEQLASAIDDAFARWDHAHLHAFNLTGDRLIVSPYFEDEPAGAEFSAEVNLSRLQPGEQFAYTFDLGDDWAHLCTVGPQRVDPYEVLGIEPPRPLAYWGWGSMPDQYGRRTADDDGEAPLPPDPNRTDLPPLLPWWGSRLG